MAHPGGEPSPVAQEVRFCRAPDGVRLAYALHGSGPPLVVAACWLSHLQYDWQSPVWRHFLDDLGSMATVLRYDERGFGLSDWDVHDFSLDARLGDLEAVVDDAGLDEFALLGMSQGGPVAIRYAGRHPHRVNRLVFYGSYADRTASSAEEAEENEAYRLMMKVGWARPDGAFRRVFTSAMIPGASETQMCWVDDLLRMSTSPENAVSSFDQRVTVDVSTELAALSVPTLVLHAEGDHMVPIEHALPLVRDIPGARLVVLGSDNHIVLGDEAARATLAEELRAFLQPAGHAAPAVPSADLSPREQEIVALAAEGHDNAEIAERLTLSVRTVERHLQNIYLKLGVSGRSARAAAVARFLTPS